METRGRVTVEDFVPYVRHGRSVLDRHYGHHEWTAKIDWAQLRMGSFTDCILGQLFGHYDNGVHVLFGEGVRWKDLPVQAAGFVVPDKIDARWSPMEQGVADLYDTLGEAWQQVLAE